MSNALESADRELLQLLHRNGGATIQQICAAEGITATAVRHRLGKLQLLEMVDREVVRSGRGRPHHVYNLTEIGFRELGENFAELAMVLWQAVRSIEDASVRGRVLASVRESMVSRYGGPRSDSGLGDRFTGLARSLGEYGFQVEVDDSGDLPILRENSCPYHELAARDNSICEMEQEVFSALLGTEVQLSTCCLDGGGCCEFTPVPDDANRSGG